MKTDEVIRSVLPQFFPEHWLDARGIVFSGFPSRIRILLPEIQDQFSQAMGAEFLVSLPHRDDCFCWSLAQPMERQERHAQDALAAFLQDDYNLTPDILLYARGGFQLHRQQIAADIA